MLVDVSDLSAQTPRSGIGDQSFRWEKNVGYEGDRLM